MVTYIDLDEPYVADDFDDDDDSLLQFERLPESMKKRLEEEIDMEFSLNTDNDENEEEYESNL